MRPFLSLYTFCASLICGAVVRGELPQNWKPGGCWSDIPSSRTLSGAYYVDPVFNNWETCVSFCDAREYTYAGVEYGRECYCGNEILSGATQEPDASCDMACVYGTRYEKCGGPNRLTLFQNDDQWY